MILLQTTTPTQEQTVVLDPGQMEQLVAHQQANTLAVLIVLLVGFFFICGPLVVSVLKGR